MEYIKHDTKETISLEDIKSQYKNSSFPYSPSETLLKSMGYYLIHDGKIPEYDTWHQFIEYEPEIKYNKKDDTYERIYVIKEKDIADLRKEKITNIDNEVSAKILAGFEAEINGEAVKFSYDEFDQQNFADQANIALNYKINNLLDKEIKWPCYKIGTNEQVTITFLTQDFIDFYVNIVIEHKNDILQSGKERKKAAMVEGILPEILKYI